MIRTVTFKENCVDVFIPNKAWLLNNPEVDGSHVVIGLYDTKEEFELAYERYAILSEGELPFHDVMYKYYTYIPLPKERKHYTYWYKYIYYELKYRLCKLFNLK